MKRKQVSPTYAEAVQTLTPHAFLCPFTYETTRGLGELAPCSDRYIDTCGCHKSGVPRPRPHWKRSNV